MIPLCAPSIGSAELELVTDCVKSGWVSSIGSYVDRFEKKLARATNTEFAVATSSGTAAIHLALIATGVKPGDEVLVSNLTFIAPVNAITYVGAHPVLVDAESQHWQMDFDLVERFLEHDCKRCDGTLVNKLSGRRIRGLLVVHILGHPVDMKRAIRLSRRFNLVLIEDATESLGAVYNGARVGGFGDVGCLSFNGNKLLTTGGGGMLVTNNERVAKNARYLSTQAKDDPIEYIHSDVGFNYRLTNIQAALGVAQSDRLDEFVEKKREIAQKYSEAFATIPGIEVPMESPYVESAFWLYTILINDEEYGMSSRDLLQSLHDLGIQCRPLWQPIHLNSPYTSAQTLGTDISIDLQSRAISIPCSVGISEKEQMKVIRSIISLSNSHLKKL